MALVPNLARPTDDRMVAGVCSGIARYLKIDTSVVRAVMVVAVLMGAVGLWLYPLLWVLMPEEGSDRAGADVLVEKAKQWKADNDAKRSGQAPASQTPPARQPVFNPYEEPRN